MKIHQLRPLPQAGGNHYKLRLAIIGRKVVLVVPPGMTGVVISLRKATESQFSPGAVAQSKAGDARPKSADTAFQAWCQDSKVSPTINN